MDERYTKVSSVYNIELNELNEVCYMVNL